jgi:Tol biopolymer transport system component
VTSLRLSFLLCVCLGLVPFVGLGVRSSAQAGPATQKYRTNFVAYDVQKKATTILFTIDGEWHAPNFTPDGKYIVSDMGNALYRIPVSGAGKGKPEKIYASPNRVATNDHAVSWDGKQVADTAIKLPMPAKIRGAADIPNPIVVMNLDGSAPHEVHMGWLHGWSPDGEYLVYTGTLQDSASIYRINADGSGELRLTTAKGADDGPEYSADGKWVYFCSNRSGKWDAWRMPADGAGPDDKLAEKITNNADTQDWFPHISPDGKWLYTVSYPMDHPDHNFIGDGMKIKLLALKNGVGAKGAALTTVRTFFGGQGAANTGGWSADSKKFAWTEYEKTSAQAK